MGLSSIETNTMTTATPTRAERVADLCATRAELVAGLCAIYDTQDAGDWGRAQVMGIAFDEKLAKSNFIIDELMAEAYFLKAA
jgi:hypothetical protein